MIKVEHEGKIEVSAKVTNLLKIGTCRAGWLGRTMKDARCNRLRSEIHFPSV